MELKFIDISLISSSCWNLKIALTIFWKLIEIWKSPWNVMWHLQLFWNRFKPWILHLILVHSKFTIDDDEFIIFYNILQVRLVDVHPMVVQICTYIIRRQVALDCPLTICIVIKILENVCALLLTQIRHHPKFRWQWSRPTSRTMKFKGKFILFTYWNVF